ncbi:VRR-NUC domain-containing protein [Dysgonomonas sp. 521]|nr:VRR-NUC domain-containing protein [Dysgonomonas sp. 521]
MQKAIDEKEGKKPKRNISHEEDNIQEAFFSTARMIFPKLDKLLFAVPNGGKRDKKEAARFKRQGVVPGVSDILCLVSNNTHTMLCLETKTEEGTQSEEQIKFQKQIEAAGGLYLIYRNAAEGIELLKEYLSTTNYR